MTRRIHYPAKTEKRDSTGLTLAGRHTDGRYQYRSLSVFRDRNVVALTHPARVGLAICKAVADAVRGHPVRVYPMTKETAAHGYGTYGASQLWLIRPMLAGLGAAYIAKSEALNTRTSYCLDMLAHEMGHNSQPRGTKPHGPEFDKAYAKMRVEVNRVMSKGWPKIGRMQDSVAPHLRAKAAKKARKLVAASESPATKWARKLALAEKNLAAWESRQTAAERKVVGYEKKVRHARVWLARSERELEA